MKSVVWYLRSFSAWSAAALAAVAAAAAAHVLAVVPVPLIVRHAFDVAIPEGRDGLILGLGLMLLVLQLGGSAAGLWARHRIFRANEGAITRLRAACIEKLYALSMRYHGRADAPTLHDVVVTASGRIETMSNALLARAVPSVLVTAAVAVVLAVIDWQLFLVTFSLVPVMIWANRLMGRRLRAALDRSQRAVGRFSDAIFSALDTMALTRIRDGEAAEQRLQLEHAGELGRAERRSATTRQTYVTTQMTLIASSGVVVLIAGGLAVAYEAITLGELFSFYAGLALLRNPLNSIFKSLPETFDGARAAEKVRSFLAEPDVRPYRGRRIIKPQGRIEVRGVSFRYDDRRVLHSVTLNLEPGRVVGLVGPNGSGKTTLVSLIAGFHRPETGALYADGVRYDDLDLSTLRRAIGWVPQEPQFLDGSAWQNLTYGVDEPAAATVFEATRAARIHDTLANLPAGYDTPLGRQAGRLSRGERQRLAIARALVGGPRILILDEPANHLDDESLVEVLAAALDGHQRPAVLVISHRVQLHRHLHQVYHLVNGRIVSAASASPAGGAPRSA